MRYLWSVLSVVLVATAAWADRICIDKTTGQIREYQSSATAGTLIQNAVKAGLRAEDVEEREVTPETYRVLTNAQTAPQRQADAAMRAAQRQHRLAARAKLKAQGLTDAELDAVGVR